MRALPPVAEHDRRRLGRRGAAARRPGISEGTVERKFLVLGAAFRRRERAAGGGLSRADGIDGRRRPAARSAGFLDRTAGDAADAARVPDVRNRGARPRAPRRAHTSSHRLARPRLVPRVDRGHRRDEQRAVLLPAAADRVAIVPRRVRRRLDGDLGDDRRLSARRSADVPRRHPLRVQPRDDPADHAADPRLHPLSRGWRAKTCAAEARVARADQHDRESALWRRPNAAECGRTHPRQLRQRRMPNHSRARPRR